MPLDLADLLIALLPRLRRYAAALTRSQDLADDLVQAACERALAAERGPGSGVPFDAWMFRIVRNLWIDGLRRGATEGEQVDIEEHAELAAGSGDEASSRLMLLQVMSAIDRLPVDQREVLLLVCAEQMSYRDTAALLGVPIGTVMSRLARARARLMEMTGISAASGRSDG
jgi:RNA polymerase sigma-70 factor (ECF subfamily)